MRGTHPQTLNELTATSVYHFNPAGCPKKAFFCSILEKNLKLGIMQKELCLNRYQNMPNGTKSSGIHHPSWQIEINF